MAAVTKFAVAAALALATPARAQHATLAGRVTDAATHEPVAGVLVTIEGVNVAGVSDSAGRFHLNAVPPGPQVLLARRIGYAPTRLPFTAPATGTATLDVAWRAFHTSGSRCNHRRARTHLRPAVTHCSVSA